MPLIRKTTFTYVVYHEADDEPVNLPHAMWEANQGSMVGSTIDMKTESVHPDKLVDELVAIGNDGTFFDTEE